MKNEKKSNEEKKYRVINLVCEYGQRLDGCKYAVATALSEQELQSLYDEELKNHEPFLYLTKEMGDAIVESQSNESKHTKRQTHNEISNGYEGGESKCFLPTSQASIRGCDPAELLITAQEAREQEMQKQRDLKLLQEAIAQLTHLQQSRLRKNFFEKKSVADIAKEEGTHFSTVDESIKGAKKKIEKYFSKHPEFRVPNSQ